MTQKGYYICILHGVPISLITILTILWKKGERAIKNTHTHFVHKHLEKCSPSLVIITTQIKERYHLSPRELANECLLVPDEVVCWFNHFEKQISKMYPVQVYLWFPPLICPSNFTSGEQSQENNFKFRRKLSALSCLFIIAKPPENNLCVPTIEGCLNK